MNKNLQNSNALTISPVENKKDLDLFIKVPELLFSDDPNWVTPLMIERRMFFSENITLIFNMQNGKHGLREEVVSPLDELALKLIHSI